jgi:ribosomal protein L14
MGYSFQRYLIAMDDTIYRMANTAFDRMLNDPTSCRLPELADQRVRTTEVVVALVDREPVAVVRTSFAVLVFDDAGCVDVNRYRKQQYARVETALAPAFAGPDRDQKVVDAASQFIAQGGAWSPSAALARVLGDVALGRQSCLRLGDQARKA